MKIPRPNFIQTKNDILAGMVASFVMVPEVVGFALVAGFNPIMGLWTAFILGLITALIGGKPGAVSGAAGSMAVVIVGLAISHGVGYVLWAGVFAGIFQILIGVFKLGKFIRFVPQPAIFGFVNGLAIVIAMSQLQFFKSEGAIIYILVGITMLIMFVLPKFTKAIPAGLVAIIGLGTLSYTLHLDTKLVSDLGNISGTLPHFSIPHVPLNWETLKIILPYSIILALVGLIESLLTLSVLDEIGGERGDGNKECIAQGIGNTTCGFFGAMSGCAMIGQSIINTASGGTTRLSSVTTSILIILFVVSIPGIIGEIPIGVLVGIMFMVSIKTFEWASLSRIKSMSKPDAFILIAVTLITIFADLAIAVIVGVIISALVFAYQQAKIKSSTKIEKDGTKIYELEGPLFFGSSSDFINDIFNVNTDPKNVIIDFSKTRVMDSSGIEAIDKITKKYLQAEKSVKLRHLSDDCKKALQISKKFCTYELDDPNYKVARDL
ncbi:SulP family inorganic anion transporter [Helicobacter cappadocius]|uniref:SulP family inorganic anion transporter n=1 Tax=Helicobacter cappadocius TaxID=3063998 RepID=A0AA90PJG4_9HELI|nr:MULTISPECIES: SulP family inorganic anion transporter [unclassified Helicobacter]MDO7252447.1 SulP family inorganic anion transporter [Helicobacter sp. faydin-H75]MDP2538314.1 SulP family inorganic anion transporter [Helicobacter sp. faydin-H76]